MARRPIEWLRWVCVLPAAFLAGFVGDVFMAGVVMPLWFPDVASVGVSRWWLLLIRNFLGWAGFVIAGAKVAPRLRLQTAVVLATLSSGWVILVHWVLHGDFPPVGANLVAVLSGVAAVYFSEKPKAIAPPSE